MLDIKAEYKRGILFVRLYGILNSKTSIYLKDKIREIVFKGGIKYMLINCEKLFSIDSNGIDAINDSCKEIIDSGGKVFVCGFSEGIRLNIGNSKLKKNILKTTNELSVFNIVKI